MRKYLLAVSASVFMVLLLSAASVWAAPKVTLKAISFLDKGRPDCVMANEWVNRVNKELNGTLNIQYIGGPEIVPPKDQIDAVTNGVVDISFIAVGWYTPRIPVANVMHLSRLTPWDERKPGGLFDYMVNAHRKIGVEYLGRWLYGSYYLWVNEPVSRLEDLKGKKLRTGGIYTPFMERIGVVPVHMKNEDVYTGLERKMISGFGQPLWGTRTDGWTEQCKYIIDHGFYTISTAILMNEKRWAQLTPPVQKKLTDITAAWEHDMVAHYKGQEVKEWEALKADGVKKIVFQPAEAKKYLDAAYSALWDDSAKRINKDELARLKKILGYQ